MPASKNIKIMTKVTIGFGIVLALLLVISASSGFNLYTGDESFKRYRAIALQANQAGRVQANLLEARLAVKNFIINASDEAIAKVKERASATLTLNQKYATLVTNQAKKDVITQSSKRLQDYLVAFDQVTTLQARRNDLVLNQLDVIGPQMEQKLSAIMQGSYDDTDVTAAFHAGKVLRNVLLLRLYATKYLVTNDAAAYERAIRESTEMRKKSIELANELSDPARHKLANEVVTLEGQYEEALKAVHETIVARNDIITNRLDKVGPEVANVMETLKLEIKKEQDLLGPQTSKAMGLALDIAIIVSIISLIIGITAAWKIGTGISRPISAITTAMKALAGGDKTVEIPGQDHGDEIGDMAKAVLVFKENMIKADELAARELESAKAREARGRKIEEMTGEFDTGVSELLRTLASSATEMEATATSMSSIADGTKLRAATVASAAEQASANVQTVATATEELSSSIQEISRQVAKSTEVAGRAVAEANKTDQQVQGLADAAQKIGEVVQMISDIAEQTNLLALNATIEAARAGESGKGFAVVASEVKNLANQTAKATNEIGQQIGAIQTETLEAVEAIKSITTTISEMDEIASMIAAAVEEQGAATHEIARNVEQAATGTQEVSSNIIEVTAAAGETGTAATQVTGVAGDLNQKADQLKVQVENFLADVRAA